LRQLGIEARDRTRLIEVWNKVDLLDGEARARARNRAERRAVEDRPVMVSALSGEGLPPLLAQIEAQLAARRVTLDLVVDAADGAAVSWLYRHAEVMNKALRGDGALAITVRADPVNAEKVRAKFDRPGSH
jgi:GTP-binding protein HflX